MREFLDIGRQHAIISVESMLAPFQSAVVLDKPSVILYSIVPQSICTGIAGKFINVIGRDFVKIQIIRIDEYDVGFFLL